MAQKRLESCNSEQWTHLRDTYIQVLYRGDRESGACLAHSGYAKHFAAKAEVPIFDGDRSALFTAFALHFMPDTP